MPYLPVTCTGRAPVCDYRHARVHACRSSSKPGMRTCHVDPSSPPSPPCPSRSAPRYSAPAAPRRHHRRRTARPRGTPRAIEGRLDSKLGPRPGRARRAPSPRSSSSTRSPAATSTADGGSPAEVKAAAADTEALADEVVPQQATARSAASAAPKQIATLTNLVAGTLVTGDAAQVRALADSPDVVAVYRVTPKTADERAQRRVHARAEGVAGHRPDRRGRPHRRHRHRPRLHARRLRRPRHGRGVRAGLRRGRLRPGPGGPRSTRPSSSAGTTSPAPLYSASDDLEGASPVPTPDENPIDGTYLSDNVGPRHARLRHRCRLRRPARRHHVRAATTAA